MKMKVIRDKDFRLDRCIKAHTREDQALFPIIQGGLDLKLRSECIEEMAKRAKVGIAIGGQFLLNSIQFEQVLVEVKRRNNFGVLSPIVVRIYPNIYPVMLWVLAGLLI